MTDVWLKLGASARARQVLKTIGLPLPLPAILTRAQGPIGEAPLRGLRTILSIGVGGTLGGVADDALRSANAEVVGVGASGPVDAIVVDASGVRSAGDLTILREIGSILPSLARAGRVVVLGRAIEDAASASEAAARGALSGFVRSVAKEIGRNGSTANLIVVRKGASERLAPALTFVLSRRAAFISGQPIVISTTAEPVPIVPIARSLAGKIALVTGAARGIGAATARSLAAEGAHVVVLDRPAEDATLRDLARSISGTPLALDLLGAHAPAAIAGALRERGGVDIVVHNAGITRDRTLARMSASEWDAVLAVNLDAIIRLQAELDGALRDFGRVVCSSSIAGIAGNVGQSAYAASKSGVIGFVTSEATRLAPRGITVNAVAPGFIETRLTAAIPLVVREFARRLSALGQGGEPEDVAAAITFLASPGAHGITAATVRVCGGSFVGA